ncbi:MAG: flagellar biosynthesis anti-sigma factor FlgM [Methylophaga sp.]|nr:flagellar biosynthesis anti-sigma factor FlgM [Methylophaga sp.]
MSEINIKTVGQSGLNSTRNVDSRENPAGAKTANVQNDVNTTRTDTVSLTEAATQLQSVQQALVDAPVVNNERVEALRAAIADGSYKVDASELAQDMINFETALR